MSKYLAAIFRKTLLFAAVGTFVFGGAAAGAPAPKTLPPPVEVFDVQQGKVVHTLPLSKSLHRKIINAINDSPKPYEGVTVNPTGGLIVHAVFPEPEKLRNPLYPEPVEEAYLFLEPKRTPLALLFYSRGHRPRVYTLEADPERLIKAVQPKDE